MSYIELSSIKIKSAKKNYNCDACHIINESVGMLHIVTDLNLTQNEASVIIKAISDNCQIKKGDAYVKIVGISDGDFMVFRAISEIDTICRKYDLYTDD